DPMLGDSAGDLPVLLSTITSMTTMPGLGAVTRWYPMPRPCVIRKLDKCNATVYVAEVSAYVESKADQLGAELHCEKFFLFFPNYCNSLQLTDT
ncbi:hypothetical protein H4S08_004809, partial [Coemansia sp. RSA 1365]